jgi:hypothetical protein
MTTVQDITVVAEHTGTAGAVTWWRLSGVIDYDRLVAEWKAAGFPLCDLPAPPSDTSALRRALEVYRAANTLVRSLPGGGYAIVDEDFAGGDNDDPEYEVRFKVWIDEQEMALSFDREMDEAELDVIHDTFMRCRRELHHQDVSAWLVKRCKAVQSIGLRDTGGIYFVPEQFAPTWSLLADLLARCSASRIYEIPALKNDRAVEAIMEAVINDAADHVAKLTKALDEKDLGERGLRGKATKCEALATKLRLYEELLGRKMEAITARVQEVDARISDLILMSED